MTRHKNRHGTFDACPDCGDTDLEDVNVEIERDMMTGELDRSILYMVMRCNACGCEFKIRYNAIQREDV
jgi:uncharacterized protein (DUF983 family)